MRRILTKHNTFFFLFFLLRFYNSSEYLFPNRGQYMEMIASEILQLSLTILFSASMCCVKFDLFSEFSGPEQTVFVRPFVRVLLTNGNILLSVTYGSTRRLYFNQIRTGSEIHELPQLVTSAFNTFFAGKIPLFEIGHW